MMCHTKKSYNYIILTLALSAVSFSYSCRDYQYFQDMHYSPAVDAQKQDLIGDRKGNFLPPENTIPFGGKQYPLTNALDDYPKADYVLKDPLKKSDKSLTLRRGKEKYDIYCSPCHGLSGKGDGKIKEKWPAIRPVVYVKGVDVAALKWGIGRLYHVVRVGIRSMQGYAAQIPEEDRWRVAHYVKYLQKKSLKDLKARGRSK